MSDNFETHQQQPDGWRGPFHEPVHRLRAERWQHLRLTTEVGVATVTLARPEKLNALTFAPTPICRTSWPSSPANAPSGPTGPHLHHPHWTLHAAAEQGYAGPGASWSLPYRAGSRPPPTGRTDAPKPRLTLG
ncbi:hypothetical protein ACFQ6U_02140 [Streptomyces sp. NPDC056465]|uniref:hypothetical protein n=1 Tax=Streptomyces sp. NPDC056465 TaxID=3345829 RepID=UPI00367A097B